MARAYWLGDVRLPIKTLMPHAFYLIIDKYSPCASHNELQDRCIQLDESMFCQKAHAEQRAQDIGCNGTHLAQKQPNETVGGLSNYTADAVVSEGLNNFWSPCESRNAAEVACKDHKNNFYCTQSDAKARALEIGCNNESHRGYFNENTGQSFIYNIFKPCSDETYWNSIVLT